MIDVEAEWQLALSVWNSGDHGAAEKILRKILLSAPDHLPTLMLYGVYLTHEKRYQSAIDLFAVVVMLNPELPQGYLNLAKAGLFLDRKSQALAAGEKALKLRPTHVETASMVAYLGFFEGKHAQSARIARWIAQVEPTGKNLYPLAKHQREYGMLEEAIANFLAILAVEPDNADAYKGYVQSLDQLKRGRRIMASGPKDKREFQQNIYIKCYSRPIYVDRCLKSIKRFASGYGRLILLNDGIGPEYLEKIRKEHPEVEVVMSPKLTTGIVAAPPNERLRNRIKHFRDSDYLDPSRFWFDAISDEENDYFMIIEEDCWLARDFDLAACGAVMQAHNTMACHMLYSMFFDENKGNIIDQRHGNYDVGPDISVEINSVNVDLEVWSNNYHIFPVANAPFRKEYFLNAYDEIYHWTDEVQLLRHSSSLISWMQQNGGNPTFGCIKGNVVRHSKATTARSDAGGNGIAHVIDPYVFNEILNQLWLEGTIDCMEGFPLDMPEEYLVQNMQPHVDERGIEQWKNWRMDFLRKFDQI